ncbi:MAG TPA: hypothetical protein PK728_03900 [Bacillota bacterium]|nr:hypothetical protein [Bacillota bacterium]
MKVKFKRSFIGYDPVAVEVLLKDMDAEYKAKLRELKNQLADEAHRLELLRVEIKKVKGEIESCRALENEISQILLGAHFEATKKIYDALKDAERKEKSASAKILARKNVLAELKSEMTKIKEEIQSIASRRKLPPAGNEGEEPDACNKQ